MGNLTKLISRTTVVSLVLLALLSLPMSAFATDPPILIGGGGLAAPSDPPVLIGGGGYANPTDPPVLVGGGGYAEPTVIDDTVLMEMIISMLSFQ